MPNGSSAGVGELPMRFDSNTIWVPSGDQLGNLSKFAEFVRFVSQPDTRHQLAHEVQFSGTRRDGRFCPVFGDWRRLDLRAADTSYSRHSVGRCAQLRDNSERFDSAGSITSLSTLSR